MSSIVIDLQDEILSSDCDIVQILRRAHVIAVKLGLKEFDQWISYELNGCYEMTFFNQKSQRTFTCQIVQNTKRHLKRAKTMQISGIGHSVIRGLVTTGQWFSASTTVYPRGSPQGRRHSYFVDC